MISSLSMALKYSLNEVKAANKIDQAIRKFIESGNRTIDITTDENYLKTSEVANKIIEMIKDE